MAKEKRPIEFFLKANYPITIYNEPEGGYVIELEDLPGCMTEGETLEEALKRIEDARQAWIESAYEDGIDIPLPRTEQEYSGKFIVRMSKTLHRHLAEQAEREGVSLNQHVETILSAAAANKNMTDEVLLKINILADYIKKQPYMGAFSQTAAYSIKMEPKVGASQSGAVYRRVLESRKQEIAA